MKKIWIIWLIIILPVSVIAQSKASDNNKASQAQGVAPSWAAAHNYDATAHVYFPDYYTFYDPKRGGYVFWENGKWVFSPAVPPYLEKVDLSKTRVQILKGISLDLYPELDYPYYMKLYPPVDGNDMVPVPIPGNPAGNN
jgi:hypothetical protein